MTKHTTNTKNTFIDATKAEKEHFLEQYEHIKQRIQILTDRIRNMKADQYAIRATDYGHEKTASTNKKTDLSDLVSRTIDNTDAITAEIEELNATARYIYNTLRIRTKNIKHLNILELYYIDGKTRQQCADTLDLWHVNSFDKKRSQALNSFRLTQEDIYHD